MYHKILVPVAFDADHDGHRGVAIARALAAPDAEITLLHVMEEVPAYAISYMPPEFREQTRAAVTEALQGYADEMGDGRVAVVEGSPGSRITHWAQEHGCDLIVISSHRPGLQDYVLGSTAGRVVRHAPCAVHVIR